MKTITVRLTDEEYEKIKKFSLASGMNMSLLFKKGIFKLIQELSYKIF